MRNLNKLSEEDQRFHAELESLFRTDPVCKPEIEEEIDFSLPIYKTVKEAKSKEDMEELFHFIYIFEYHSNSMLGADGDEVQTNQAAYHRIDQAILNGIISKEEVNKRHSEIIKEAQDDEQKF